MNKKVVIIGASGQGKVIADIVKASGDIFVGFLDDDSSKNPLGPVSDYNKYLDCYYVIGIGHAETREKFSKLPVKWYTAIHPTAVIGSNVVIGEGTVIMPYVVINVNSKIGNHCIINTNAVVEHDNIIKDLVHISVGVNIGGTVIVGKYSWIGIGSSIINNISICDNCVIGAGGIVIKDILLPGTYVGIPVKRIK